ncbi:hypothetical protein [Mycoavidus sp. SF9855]|uniref:hypothetical protein n=1 Tax=Mycoavidus sp. SF9855 TaxID=2968475 RepID=UPI00211C905D|nr:hypothetical protein [Mycoavidus sp. SF9855]UUM20841.1 hypothetical protein NQD60_05005 [Mycoavidus sp. SF9855]
MKAYKYIVDECDPFEYASCFNSDWEWNESMSIQIFKEDGTSLGVFNVGYDLEPQFWVWAEGPAQRSNPC